MAELHDSGSSRLHIAEVSRPRRGIKEEQRQKNKPQGRRRLSENGPAPAKNTNWTDPLLWAHIEAATARVGFKSPADIKRHLTLNSPPGMFDRLREQLIGKWIDKEAEPPRWKDSTLRRVAKGNHPGGQNTRQGVLVRLVHLHWCYQ